MSETYSYFVNSVNAFLSCVLLVVLDSGEHLTVVELVQNQGSWHKSSNLKFRQAAEGYQKVRNGKDLDTDLVKQS